MNPWLKTFLWPFCFKWTINASLKTSRQLNFIQMNLTKYSQNLCEAIWKYSQTFTLSYQSTILPTGRSVETLNSTARSLTGLKRGFPSFLLPFTNHCGWTTDLIAWGSRQFISFLVAFTRVTQLIQVKLVSCVSFSGIITGIIIFKLYFPLEEPDINYQYLIKASLIHVVGRNEILMKGSLKMWEMKGEMWVLR